MTYLGLAALSAAMLLLQLTLTRVYSVAQGYHFAFLAVSLALLGFGASGTALFVAPRLLAAGRRRLLGGSALLFTLAAPAAYWAINAIPFDAYRLVLEPEMFGHLVLFYLVPVVPFLFAGVAQGGALSLEPGKAGRLYGAGLAGSGVGALLASVGPAAAGPSTAVALVTGLGAAAWGAFVARRPARSAVPAAAIAAALVAGGWLLPGRVELRMSPYKALPSVLRLRGSELVSTEWNAFSRVDVVESEALHVAPGLSFAPSSLESEVPAQTAVTVDGGDLTAVTHASPGEAVFTEYLPGAAAYALLDRPRVLVLEPGGGMDVLAALHHGARDVVAVAGNPLEADILRDAFREDTAGAEPRLRIVTGNPRSYLERESGRFDLVVVSLRDAFRPVTAGAYSLGENHVYTKEAFQAYYRHLAPGGVLAVTRWTQVPPSEDMRMAATAVEALEGLGVGDLASRFAAVRTLQTLTLLVKEGPYARTEVEQLRAFAASRQMDLSWLPGLAPEEMNRFFVLQEEVYHAGLTRLFDSEQRAEFYRQQQFDVAPATDDRPFFFHFFRWRQVPDVIAGLGREWQPFGGAGFLVVLAFLAVAAVGSAALILLPLLARRGAVRRGEGERGAPSAWGPLSYFFALGFGYLWIELPLMQRFILLLDHPTYSFAVVLFAVLVFSGAGSLLSERLGGRPDRAILALGVLAVAYAVGAAPFARLILGFPLAARVSLAVLVIAPLGVLMGVPFPTGIGALRERRAGLIPWAWGVNGYASVVGSVLAALMALSWGFAWVLGAAGAVYVAAWALYRWGLTDRR
ncbi:MAG: hypothetical protein FJ313_00225 [Gemmatimonadetes bacterium]|nr:hypothetical protein [Gemmatimonadota bacterium]